LAGAVKKSKQEQDFFGFVAKCVKVNSVCCPTAGGQDKYQEL
jgi:hypothetical protein